MGTDHHSCCCSGCLRGILASFADWREHNLKLTPAKCKLLRRSVKFLGHLVSQEVIATDPDKVQAIVSLGEADIMESDGVNALC